MKCPKCKEEVGNRNVCVKCGCDISGRPVRNSGEPVQPENGSSATPVSQGARLSNKKPYIRNTTGSRSSQTPPSPGHSGGRLVIVILVLAFLAAAGGAVYFFVWRTPVRQAVPAGLSGILPAVGPSTDWFAGSSADLQGEPLAVNIDEVLAGLDALLDEGKRQAVVDTEIAEGMWTLENVMKQLVQLGEDAGNQSIAGSRIADAYSSYVSAVYRHMGMLTGQALSGALYKQIIIELDEAVSMGEYLVEEGYAADVSGLRASREEFKEVYTDRMIAAFDEFTSREMWSRTEAWNLMSTAVDNMFDTSDLDNPLRLRYAYALSWWMQKQVETELNSGTITEKGAAIRIADSMDEMDYNPMMIHYYISLMNDAGEDCTGVSDAYDEIVERLAQTQGIRIGEDIDLAHFWYFNDFITHPVDEVNGVTQENRQWIRDRMRNAAFMKD